MEMINENTKKSPVTNRKLESSSCGQLTFRTRVAYGFGDTACNVVFGMISTLLTLFYTDYVGISAASVGMVMLISRVFDGFSDVVMGFVVERTRTKWGKSRPWLLWMSFPYALSAVLLFSVPHSTGMVQFLYMFVTYNFCTTICYTAINLPYGSLSALMTRDSKQRGLLSIVRMGMSPFGRILAVTCTMPLVKLFGNTQSAWVKAMAIWAVIALIMLLICFANCKETVRIEAQEKQEKIPMKRALKALLCNQYFWAVLILWMMQNVIYGVTGTILPYYCKYILHNDTWMYSTLYLAETLTIVGATCVCPFLLNRFGKRNMSLAGAILALAGQFVFFLNPHSFGWMLLCCFIRGIGLAPLNSVVFGMLGDVVEFGQYRTHIRQESLIFAGGSVGTKIGSGLAAAAMTGLLSLAGYISSSTGAVAQPESAVNMILNIYRFAPIMIWAVVIVVLLCYRLDQQYPAIMKELNAREERGEL